MKQVSREDIQEAIEITKTYFSADIKETKENRDNVKLWSKLRRKNEE